MTQIETLLQTLQGMYYFLDGEGLIKTNLPAVRLFWATKPVERTPLLYEAGIVIMMQGYKVGHLGNRVFRYDANNYLLLTMPIPFECETYASLDNPVFGLFIDIDIAVLHDLVLVLGKHKLPQAFNLSSLPRIVEPVSLSSEMAEATKRLLKCLCSTVDSDVLGPSLIREIIYYALLGEHGHALYALTQQNCHCARIAKSLARIHQEYAQPMNVDLLARDAGMSVSAFHRVFKQITSDSPVQYLKKVRLNKAKSLIVQNDSPIQQIAYQVGYESTSQFSREFKRYFKVTPAKVKD